MTYLSSSPLPAETRLLQSKWLDPHPPGPPWPTAAQNMFSFLRNALDFLLEMRERYGDVVSMPTLVGPFTLIFHPDGVRHVLQENHRNYNKDIPDYHVLSLVLGKGLLTNDGGSWLKQRHLIQPAFHRERVATFGTLMTETSSRWTQRWETGGFIETNKPLALTFAYFPFGGGSRLCLGNQFALYEAQLILATILSRYQLRLLPGAVITPEPLVTLRPRGDLLMIMHRRPEMKRLLSYEQEGEKSWRESS